MSLSPGTRLGPYEIVAPLGAGGMGEVYKARDTRLGRDVAIKVLPPHLSESPEARARFQREAKAISGLTHPHICTLHDVGHHQGVDFLVMELLEGGTLADRLDSGALPLEQVFRFGVEIADALERAHRAGVVHRDLKPGNVILTKSGVKLLDFGLARLAPTKPAASGLSALPTEAAPSRPLTEKGTVMGTVQYMAPEQLEGKDADARTDIFALGCVLYEMATGKKAFSGASQASLITAIMSGEPAPISTLAPMTPPAFGQLIRTCLAKDPDERWQSAHDVKSELRWIAQAGSQAGLPAVVATRGKSRERGFWIAAVAILLAAIPVSILRSRNPVGLTSAMRTSIVLSGNSGLRAALLSPDGTNIAVVARDSSGRSLLAIRPIGSLVVRPLPGTENASFPVWSPDGRSIGFFADGKLKRIDVAGGPPQAIADAPIARGATWNRDGVILFSPVPDGPLYRVSAAGGPATPATRFDPRRGETSHRWPFFLPDGKHFLYEVASFGPAAQAEKMGIYVGSLASTEDRFLLRVSSSAAYVPMSSGSPGYVLFVRDQNLFAQAFDADALRLAGDPRSLAEGVEYFPEIHQAVYSASRNELLLSRSESPRVSQLTWLDRDGRKLALLGGPGNQANPRISPDGKSVALDIVDQQTGNLDVWVYAAAGGAPSRLTSDPALDSTPVWSPDGTQIVFTSMRRNRPDLFRRSSTGAGADEAILLSGEIKFASDWSPDGRSLLYTSVGERSNFELWTLPANGNRLPTPFLKAAYGVKEGQFSPDGKWVAYASNESGRWEIDVTPFPGPGRRWTVSTAGGSEPRWRRDGEELFYLAPDGELMAVGVKEGQDFQAEAAKPLFVIRRPDPISSTDLYSYDVSSDGQRFLVNADASDVGPPNLTLDLNWTANLGR